MIDDCGRDSKYLIVNSSHGENFKILRADYDRMYDAQKGLCAICTRPERKENRRMAVDHCHATGTIRGLLCLQCNTKLGWFEELRMDIIRYLDDPPFNVYPLSEDMLGDKTCDWCEKQFSLIARKGQRFCSGGICGSRWHYANVTKKK